jgi:hypothetical protein
MLLRDHPLMMFRGNRSWPPDWLWRDGYEDTHPRGEIGILKNVIRSPTADGCFLIMEHCGAEYIGAVLLSDQAFSRDIFRLLARSSGKTIREIGDIDLTHTALKRIAEMSTGKNQDKFKLIAQSKRQAPARVEKPRDDDAAFKGINPRTNRGKKSKQPRGRLESF